MSVAFAVKCFHFLQIAFSLHIDNSPFLLIEICYVIFDVTISKFYDIKVISLFFHSSKYWWNLHLSAALFRLEIIERVEFNCDLSCQYLQQHSQTFRLPNKAFCNTIAL